MCFPMCMRLCASQLIHTYFLCILEPQFEEEGKGGEELCFSIHNSYVALFNIIKSLNI